MGNLSSALQQLRVERKQAQLQVEKLDQAISVIEAPRKSRTLNWLAVALVAVLMSSSLVSLAQTTVGTGSIVGTVTDPSTAVLSGAKVTITNLATGHVMTLTTNSSGAFNSGALIPGDYKVQVGARGFRQMETPVTVLVGNTATANAKLQLGQESQVVEVQGSAVQVNTEQATVQGVLNAEQIENLPVNGRNFLDLAQLSPGFRSRMDRTSIRRRRVFHRFHSGDDLAAPPASKSTASTFPMKPSAQRPWTFLPAGLRSSNSANRAWIFPMN